MCILKKGPWSNSSYHFAAPGSRSCAKIIDLYLFHKNYSCHFLCKYDYTCLYSLEDNIGWISFWRNKILTKFHVHLNKILKLRHKTKIIDYICFHFSSKSKQTQNFLFFGKDLSKCQEASSKSVYQLKGIEYIWDFRPSLNISSKLSKDLTKIG